jgi:hypothetical protein
LRQNGAAVSYQPGGSYLRVRHGSANDNEPLGFANAPQRLDAAHIHQVESMPFAPLQLENEVSASRDHPRLPSPDRQHGQCLVD